MFSVKYLVRKKCKEAVNCALKLSAFQSYTNHEVRCVSTVSSLFQPINLTFSAPNDAKAKKDEQQLAKSQRVMNDLPRFYLARCSDAIPLVCLHSCFSIWASSVRPALGCFLSSHLE